MIQFDYCNIFQMGWNHQLDEIDLVKEQEATVISLRISNESNIFFFGRCSGAVDLILRANALREAAEAPRLELKGDKKVGSYHRFLNGGTWGSL